MNKRYGVLKLALAAAIIQYGTMVYAQSGLFSRPINLTCVAPVNGASAATFKVVASVISQETQLHAAAGRESGVLYRGLEVPKLRGLYIYVDDHRVIADKPDTHGHDKVSLAISGFLPTSIVEGDDHEIYLLDESGQIGQLKESDPPIASTPAALLSQTGCFDVNDPSVPASGLIPYEPSAPLYSDNAMKRRWIAMPDWDRPNTQITLLPDGDFDFPVGTILIKEFSLGSRLVETRLFVRDLEGTWSGYSYEWNMEQTDAILLDTRKSEIINGQQWDFPNGFECSYCHSAAANHSLGLEIAQLNHEFLYPDSNISANQLTTLDSVGLIAGGLPFDGDVALLDRLPAYDDLSAPVNERARGYLHSNCANCHRPGAQGQGPMDFRYQLDGNDISVNDVVPWLGDLGVSGAKLLARGSPELSVISLRMKSLSFTRMPPLSSNLIDVSGTLLIDDWISSGLGFGIGDDDADNTANDLDNCSALANPDQRDTNGDGYGNLCDPDLDNDGIVNFLDLNLFSKVFLTDNADADFNGDGAVNFIDFAILANRFLSTPGPSGLIP